MQIERVLKNELDIGVSLNKATAANHRGDFSLILSLMSQDVRDMAQFEHTDKINLRSQFELPKTTPTEVSLADKADFNEHSQVFRTQNHTEFRLQQSLKPEPLVCRGSEPAFIQKALNNCDIHTVNRFKNIESKVSQKPKVAFLDQLQQQRTMAKLIECA